MLEISRRHNEIELIHCQLVQRCRRVEFLSPSLPPLHLLSILEPLVIAKYRHLLFRWQLRIGHRLKLQLLLTEDGGNDGGATWIADDGVMFR